MADWDADSEQLHQNLTSVLRQTRDQAHLRLSPRAVMARDWQRVIMAGLTVPDDRCRGTFRGEPGLETCQVMIGRHLGTPPDQVSAALHEFDRSLQRAVAALDGLIPGGSGPFDVDQLNAVIELCAWTHAEWVRIHPFANGNGRTARIWAAFIAMRYGLPPFVRLRPRPDGAYAEACDAAMKGDWAPTAQVFRRMYLELVAPI